VSSFHLWWLDAPHEPVVSVAVTLEVLEPPSVSRLYFWAMQATFNDASGGSPGGAHLGLQWNPRYPGSHAANWGGYANIGDVTSILEGTASPLPSTPNDPNTRDYPWQQGVPYRLRISRSDAGWRGEITDTTTGHTQLVRDLLAPGDRLTGATMWSEVFARCDHPSAMVRWSKPEWLTASGAVVSPTRVRVTFPSGGDCPNTDVGADGDGIFQRTNTQRTHREGDVLTLPA
jgi:hypothetical protein